MLVPLTSPSKINDKFKIVVIGTGTHAQQHVFSLQHLNFPFNVIGNSEQTCETFYSQTRAKALKGGVDANTEIVKAATHVIICLPAELLISNLEKVVSYSNAEILIEKPGFLDFGNYKLFCSTFSETNRVKVAYNRRFYENIKWLKNRSHGQKITVDIDFTERMHKVREIYCNELHIDNWIHLNSSHVFDAASFILGAVPKLKHIEFYKSSMGEHCICGIACTKNGSILNFRSHWSSASNWKLNVLSDNLMALSQNLELMTIVDNGIQFEMSSGDSCRNIKPGIVEMHSSFLSNEKILPNLNDNLALHEFIAAIKRKLK